MTTTASLAICRKNEYKSLLTLRGRKQEFREEIFVSKILFRNLWSRPTANYGSDTTLSQPPLAYESHVVQFQSQKAGTYISTEWIIAVHMAAVYEFQSKIKEE